MPTTGVGRNQYVTGIARPAAEYCDSMELSRQIAVPTLVRIKDGALGRLGIYLRRERFERVALFISAGLGPSILGSVIAGLDAEQVAASPRLEVSDASFEAAAELFSRLPASCAACVGVGGGKALDTAKYVAFLARRPYFAVPTSLSNDGFCSPQSSLTVSGRRRSLPSAMPYGIVVDTAVCAAAPDNLWLSGVGDLVSKVTAVNDWHAAFRACGTPVNDLAALLSDATVFQFAARPTRDAEGARLLATALMLNGVAMEICGSSRPASGSEHLISHALDALSARPRLHGLQVGMATYICSRLQGAGTERVAAVLDPSGFWDAIRADPFPTQEWMAAVRTAPSIKDDYYTVLSSRDCAPEVAGIIAEDDRLRGCFVE